jgi:phosphoribosylformimino-5-aminoimidazole carboxamide ribotide isomerase
VDFTGGISNDGDVGKAFEYGASYITAASIAITNPELFASWIVSYGREKMTLGSDVENSTTKKMAFRGWQKKSDLMLSDHLRYFYDRGLKYSKITDISHDGALEGPPLDFYREIKNEFPELQILASGGVRNVQDIEDLNSMGIFAVIFGKAFYEGLLNLKDLERFLVKRGNHPPDQKS